MVLLVWTKYLPYEGLENLNNGVRKDLQGSSGPIQFSLEKNVINKCLTQMEELWLCESLDTETSTLLKQWTNSYSILKVASTQSRKAFTSLSSLEAINSSNNFSHVTGYLLELTQLVQDTRLLFSYFGCYWIWLSKKKKWCSVAK